MGLVRKEKTERLRLGDIQASYLCSFSRSNTDLHSTSLYDAHEHACLIITLLFWILTYRADGVNDVLLENKRLNKVQWPRCEELLSSALLFSLENVTVLKNILNTQTKLHLKIHFYWGGTGFC